MSKVIVKKGYNIKIPSDIRKKADILEGDKINVESENKKKLTLTKDPLEISFGCWNYNKSGISYVNKIRKKWNRKIV